MFSFVKTEILEDRLDAEFYSEDQIHNLKKLKAIGVLPLKDFCTGINVGYTGELTSVYSENGVALFRVSDIDQVFLNDSNVNFIPKDFADENPNIWIKDYDIVLAAVGNTIGKVAIKSPSLPNGVCSRALMIARPSISKINPYFLVGYLACQFAQKSLIRGVSGSAQPVLNTPLIANLPVIKVNIITQKYIGDKVRQAEILREWAKNLENVFSEILISFCSDAVKYTPSGNKHSVAPLHEISHTLNPGAFNEKRLFIRKKLRELDAKTLKDVVDIYSPTTNEYTENTSYIGLDAINSNSCEITSSTVKASGVVGTARVLYEGVVISKLRPYLNKVSYIPKVFEGAVGSTELLCLKAKNNSISNWYLYGVLKSDLVLNQLEPLSTGSTHPRIDRYDIYDLIIPILPNNHELGDNLQKAQNGYLYSQKLLKMSTSLVESVIDGIISEEELIQAQNALEQGDTSLDRAILSLMTEEGYAVASSKPLFSDLDEFYDLLEQAKALE